MLSNGLKARLNNMPRYVDVDKLISEMKSLCEQDRLEFMGVYDCIKSQPTAAVVEVVRCENCKHLTIHNSPTLYAYCEKTHYIFEPFKTDARTHFCSYGERKEESK